MDEGRLLTMARAYQETGERLHREGHQEDGVGGRGLEDGGTERDIRRAELEVEAWRTVARDRASPRGTSGGRSWRSRPGGRWPGIEPHREGHQEGGVGGRGLEDGGPG